MELIENAKSYLKDKGLKTEEIKELESGIIFPEKDCINKFKITMPSDKELKIFLKGDKQDSDIVTLKRGGCTKINDIIDFCLEYYDLQKYEYNLKNPKEITFSKKGYPDSFEINTNLDKKELEIYLINKNNSKKLPLKIKTIKEIPNEYNIKLFKTIIIPYIKLCFYYYELQEYGYEISDVSEDQSEFTFSKNGYNNKFMIKVTLEKSIEIYLNNENTHIKTISISKKKNYTQNLLNTINDAVRHCFKDYDLKQPPYQNEAKDIGKYICKNDNIFANATKELTQDGFLLWLFNNYNCDENDETELNQLQKFARYFLTELLKTSYNKELNATLKNSDQIEIECLKTYKQFQKADIIVRYKLKTEELYRILIIEDKTTSSEHDNQLTKYFDAVKNDDEIFYFDDDEKRINGIYFKTDIITETEEKSIEEQNTKLSNNINIWSKINYKAILQIFNEYIKDNSLNKKIFNEDEKKFNETFDNVILDQFYEYLVTKCNRIDDTEKILFNPNYEQLWGYRNANSEIWHKFFLDFQGKHKYSSKNDIYVFDVNNYQNAYWYIKFGANQYTELDELGLPKKCRIPVLEIGSRDSFVSIDGGIKLSCNLTLWGMTNKDEDKDIKNEIRKFCKENTVTLSDKLKELNKIGEITITPKFENLRTNEQTPNSEPAGKMKKTKQQQTIANIEISKNCEPNYDNLKEILEEAFDLYGKVIKKFLGIAKGKIDF